MTLLEGILPQNDRERKRQREREREKATERERERERESDRERERERARERERERANELDAKCHDNCRKQGTTGWISLIGFARPVLNVYKSTSGCTCLVYAKFTGLSCMVPGYRLLGEALSLYSVACTSLTKNSCNTKVVFNHFDRGSYICIHMYNIYNILYI